jgi:RNA polymerase sigma factor (sigma-70 family)
MKGGDGAVDFEEIYRKYFGDVYRYMRRLSGDAGLAEDITSDAFFRALRSLDKFRGDCDIRIWLCSIARNCYYSHLQKARRLSSLETAVETADAAESPEEQVMRRGDAEEIRRALHDVPEPYREVFMWRVYGELSFKEIGRMFRRTDNWACVTYHRARNMIRERMEGGNGEK